MDNMKSMKLDFAAILLELAKRGAIDKSIEISSAKLGEGLGISQQTAARKLKKAEEMGYIAREITKSGQKIRITEKGKNMLKELYHELSLIFKERAILTLCGNVFSGLKEGSYYMSIDEYKKQFEEKLGFTPYPGTLNIRIKNEEDLKRRQELEKLPGIKINGFVKHNRSFGAVRCFKAKLGEISGAVIMPERSHHAINTVEFISDVKVRDKLKLKDGDEICLRIEI